MEKKEVENCVDQGRKVRGTLKALVKKEGFKFKCCEEVVWWNVNVKFMEVRHCLSMSIINLEWKL